jgi:hypothetical protein
MLGGLGLAGCGMMGPPAQSPLLNESQDPTPLARCKVAASASNPLVTEWPASQKARLESLTARQTVAVAYSGCELRIVETCHLPGRYSWKRTTPATDTVDISSADELWAKLPLGAASLEGELARKGHLAVRTTVSGQLELDGLDAATSPTDGSCAGVTHVVSAVSVGAFRLLSGTGTSAQGKAGAFGVGASGGTERNEEVLREAGDATACSAEPDAPPKNCASPIQLFLQELSRETAQPAATAVSPGAPTPASALAVQVSFPDAGGGEHWSLHDATGSLLCDVPCTRAVPPGSGWYLERATTGGGDVSRVDVPARLPYAPGSQVVADYRGTRGSPFLSTLTFWGVGVEAAIGGAVAISFGVANVGGTSDQSLTGFWIGSGVMFLAIAGASTWWWLWSHPASFDAHSASSTATGTARPTLRLGPGGVWGTF